MISTQHKWNQFKDIGFLIRHRKDLIALVCKMYECCGDYVSCHVFGSKMFLLSHPDAIELVLHAKPDNYICGEPDWSPYVRALGRGLLYSDGERHRWQRRLVQPAFQSQSIAAYAEIATEEIGKIERQWEQRIDTVVDMHQEMLHLTLAVAARVIFSDAIRSDTCRIGELSTQILLLSTELYFQPAGRFPWLPTPKQALLKRLICEYNGIIYEAIRICREDRPKCNDLLSILLQYRHNASGSAHHAQPLSENDVRDLAVTLLSAGHETTANMITWSWYLLAKNTDAWESLQNELRKVLGGRPATFDDLPRLSYTRCVLNEALRMYPPVWIIPRRVVKADVILGYHVPAGARIFVSPYIVQRDARWFHNPERFDPSRFDTQKETTRPKLSYFPFGSGGRRCIGQSFAEMLGCLVIASLAQRFTPCVEPDMFVEPDSSFFRPKGGLKMHLCLTHSK